MLQVYLYFQVAYCYIPKNGCSAWKKVLTSTTKYGKEHGMARRNVHQTEVLWKWGLGKASFGQLLRSYPQYARFLVVRHPFDRLISAYTDKIVTKRPSFYTPVRKYIIQRFREGNITKEEIEEGTPSFLEFVKMILSKSKYSEDRHWKPYGERCNPCYLEYQHLIRIESMIPDSIPVLKRLDISDTEVLDDHRHVHNEQSTKHRNQQSTKTITKIQPKYLKEFETIPKDLVQQLFQRYKEDFLLFGYQFDYRNKMAVCRIETVSGDICC